MTININFGTYNVGQGFDDYNFMLNASPEEKKKKKDEFKGLNSQEKVVQKKKELTARVEKSCAQKISKEVDVLCLQELMDLNRPFAQELMKQDFKIYRCGNDPKERISTAIAIKTDKFSTIRNKSFKSKSGDEQGGVYGQEIASIEVTLKDVKTKFNFSSLHSWGFQLYHPAQEQRDIRDLENKQRALAYAKEAVKAAKTHAGCSFIGGDMNNNTDNYRKQFSVFEKAGYDVLETTQTTNINYGDLISGYKNERKIDYLFAKGPSKIGRIWNKFISFFKTTVTMQTGGAWLLEDFEFEMDKNCSDHKPIKTTIIITPKKSKIAKIWGSFINLFRR